MEAKVTEVKTTMKDKVKAAVAEAKTRVKNGIDWCVENKEFVVGAIPAAAMAVRQVTKTVNRITNNEATRTAERMKKLHYYDRRNDTYLQLRKPLTNAQKVEFDRRKAAGESATAILTSMRVLK